MEDTGWNVMGNTFVSAERQGISIGKYGTSSEGYWLGHCRALDADAGKL